jgi:hypothetical protein
MLEVQRLASAERDRQTKACDEFMSSVQMLVQDEGGSIGIADLPFLYFRKYELPLRLPDPFKTLSWKSILAEHGKRFGVEYTQGVQDDARRLAVGRISLVQEEEEEEDVGGEQMEDPAELFDDLMILLSNSQGFCRIDELQEKYFDQFNRKLLLPNGVGLENYIVQNNDQSEAMIKVYHSVFGDFLMFTFENTSDFQSFASNLRALLQKAGKLKVDQALGKIYAQKFGEKPPCPIELFLKHDFSGNQFALDSKGVLSLKSNAGVSQEAHAPVAPKSALFDPFEDPTLELSSDFESAFDAPLETKAPKRNEIRGKIQELANDDPFSVEDDSPFATTSEKPFKLDLSSNNPKKFDMIMEAEEKKSFFLDDQWLSEETGLQNENNSEAMIPSEDLLKEPFDDEPNEFPEDEGQGGLQDEDGLSWDNEVTQLGESEHFQPNEVVPKVRKQSSEGLSTSPEKEFLSLSDLKKSGSIRIKQTSQDPLNFSHFKDVRSVFEKKESDVSPVPIPERSKAHRKTAVKANSIDEIFSEFVSEIDPKTAKKDRLSSLEDCLNTAAEHIHISESLLRSVRVSKDTLRLISGLRASLDHLWLEAEIRARNQ